jgi:hypothetical protein
MLLRKEKRSISNNQQIEAVLKHLTPTDHPLGLPPGPVLFFVNVYVVHPVQYASGSGTANRPGPQDGSKRKLFETQEVGSCIGQRADHFTTLLSFCFVSFKPVQIAERRATAAETLIKTKEIVLASWFLLLFNIQYLTPLLRPCNA